MRNRYVLMWSLCFSMGWLFSRAETATIFGDQPGKFACSNAVAVDSFGNIHVLTGDSIVVFNNSGMYIKTFWETPCRAHSGFGMAIDKEDNLYISRTDQSIIVKIDTDGKNVMFKGLDRNFIGSSKPGLTESQLQRPAGLCVDAQGFIYVADSSTVKKFTPDGLPSKDFNGRSFIGTPGEEGSDAYHLKNASAVAVDTEGNIYIVDTGNYRMLVYDKKGNPLRSIPEGYLDRPAPQKPDNGFFASPVSCAVDEEGNVYVGEFIWGEIKCCRIQKFDRKGKYITSTKQEMPIFLRSITYHQKTGSIYAGCIWNRKGGIMKFNKDLNYTGTIGAYPDQQGTFQRNTAIDIDETEAIYVCEPSDNSRLQKISGKDGSFIKMLSAERPQSVCIDHRAKHIYIMESTGKIRKFDFDLKDINFDLKFEGPVPITVDKNSNLYVAMDKKVYVFSSDGTDKKVVLEGIGVGGAGIKVDNLGNIYVTEPLPGMTVHKFPPYKGKTLTWNDRLWSYELGPFPTGMAIDEKNNLFITLCRESKLVVLNQEGKPVKINGKNYFGEFGGIDVQDGYHLLCPMGVAISGRNLYISDGHGIIKYSLKYNPDGSLEIIP